MNLLTGETIKLTALTEDDLTSITTWFENTTFTQLFDALPAVPKTKSELTSWYEEFTDTNTQFLFAIRTRNKNNFIGYIEIDGILWNHGVGWISIAIGDNNNRGKGYGYESMELALDFAFYELNLNRVQLTVFDYNQSAISLYKKLGFQQEGSYREFIHRYGKRHDMLLFGLLKREWESRTEKLE
ncbi:GNAT family N-acetyltransferase [Heyndrickxia sporothermodurans]|uniref:GNAT family N-acetyltransferase n=1 Tax=Heyndrickxia sporothermodurans TaxID=46224 RepID=UPI000D38E48F|nr:GNAT family protein [Heyndrickxia sporothermodurans]PTY77439.1 GNAT family N-acetyltransferase [Heyndrickxia sporothermodurans]